jgi:aspartyl/glutamyl-tRNA(Asn/Gln) amidotransferase C subunit
MNLTQDQIKKLANNLSKLNIEDAKLSWDINEIIKYIDLLWEVNTNWVKPTISVVDKENIFRKDIKKKKELSRKELLECSNQKIIQDQIAISNIM